MTKPMIVFTAAFAFTLLACQPGSRNAPVKQIDNGLKKPIPEVTDSSNPGETSVVTVARVQKKLKKMEWTTSGGGDMKYTVTRSGTDFDIHVTQNQYRPADIHLSLIASQKRLFERMTSLFDGKMSVVEVKIDPKLLSGTWRSVTLTDLNDKAHVVNNPSVENKGAENFLAELRQHVGDSISAKQPSSPTSELIQDCNGADLTGTWTYGQPAFQPDSKGNVSSAGWSGVSTLKVLPTKDGTIQYTGTDVVTKSGCFGSTKESESVTYLFDQKNCIIHQNKGKLISYRVTDLRVVDSYNDKKVLKSRILESYTVTQCLDQKCASLDPQAEPMILKSNINY